MLKPSSPDCSLKTKMESYEYCPECGGIQPVNSVSLTSTTLHFHSDYSCSFRWNKKLSKWQPGESWMNDDFDFDLVGLFNHEENEHA